MAPNMITESVPELKLAEYTGKNRCLPCTVINVIIALIITVAVGIYWLLGGVAFLITSLLLIYFRGYLVPGTPTLTKRHLPAWLLSLFHEAAPPFQAEAMDTEATNTPIKRIDNPHDFLLDIGVIKPCRETDDVCLAPDFRHSWLERMADFRESGVPETITDLLEADASTVSVEERDESIKVGIDGQTVGVWDSRAALIVDLASFYELQERYSGWDELFEHDREQVVGGLRVFLETCPNCGGSLTQQSKTVENCCRTCTQKIAVCKVCDSYLFSSE